MWQDVRTLYIYIHVPPDWIYIYIYNIVLFVSFVFGQICMQYHTAGLPSTSKIPNPKILQNPRSKIQTPKSRSKSVEACLPNTCLPNKCVCPPVCPTASSPKAQTFEPPLTIHFDVLFAQFFLVIKAAVLHMEFCFMTGLPQESRRFFVFANSPAQWAKCQAGNHPKSVQSLAHKRFVSQKSGTKRNWWEKIRESSA